MKVARVFFVGSQSVLHKATDVLKLQFTNSSDLSIQTCLTNVKSSSGVTSLITCESKRHKADAY